MSSTGVRKIFGKSIVDVGVFSVATNILLLVVPLYLMQIYDRVITSSSMETLLYITIIAVASLVVLGILEMVRAQYAARIAAAVDASIGTSVFLGSMNGARASLGDVQPLRDLATVRSFVSSRMLFFLFDLPFAPLFIVLLYFIHPLLCIIAVCGAVLMLAVAILNQIATNRVNRSASDTLAGTMGAAQTFARSFETIRALGMTSAVVDLWGRQFASSLNASERVSRQNAIYGGLSRTIRMVLQISILGAGSYLVINGSMTAGMIFASSIISGRALQPLDQIIGGWRQIIETAYAWKRVKTAVDAAPGMTDGSVGLPAPTGALRVEQLIYYPPGADTSAAPLIKSISFAVDAGETVAIVGPSRVGKSTLARLIVGAVKPASGTVRLDEADFRNWDIDEIGRHLGYLAQEVELFPGTVAQNIARFDPLASDESVLAAAQRAHVHELILHLPAGYETEIGPGGVRLSGGERQRIGLARAFYRDPRLLVLDEPNANLDAEGEQALERILQEAREYGATILIITHKTSIAEKCERILILRDGRIDLFGPARDVMQRLNQGASKPPGEPGTSAKPERSTPSDAGASFGQVIRVNAK